jgi:hypothetical protein
VLDVRVVSTISGPYTVNTVIRGPLVLVEGQTYTFNFPASGGGLFGVPTLHPWVLTTDPNGGPADPGTGQLTSTLLPGYTMGPHCAMGCAAGNTFTCTPGPLTPSLFYYQCTTHTNLGAMVTVLRLPVITQNPVSVTSCTGAQASFSVTATLSEGTLGYRWRRNGVPLDVAGTWGSVLTIAAVASTDLGVYDCIVSNGCASVISQPATLGRCPADLANGSGQAGCDGGVDINDLLYFLGQFESGAPAADLDDGTGTGTPDGGVDISDLLFFLSHFESGC